MISIPIQYLIIVIFLILAFFLLGLIIGLISNPRLKKNTDKTKDAVKTPNENEQEIHNPPRDYPKLNSQKPGNKENETQENGPYRRYSRNGYYNR